MLSKEQMTDLILENTYTAKNSVLSRCIDGRYQNSDDIAALAIPGADAGELGAIFALANTFGYTLDMQKALDALIEVVGGVKNIQFHTDSHAEAGKILGGCGHIKQMGVDFERYSLTEEQLDFIKKSFVSLKEQGAQEIVLQGDHREAALLFIKGTYGVLPQFTLGREDGNRKVHIFVFQRTLADIRHRLLAQKLIDTKAIQCEGGLDEETVFLALSETMEDHLMETTKRLAVGLPIFEVAFLGSAKEFKLEDLGRIE